MSNEMTTTQRCIVLGVGKPYNFVPDGETEAVDGCKMAYIGTTDLETPCFDEESGLNGIMPQKIRMEPAFYDAVKEIPLPSVADITFAITLGTSGAKVKISDIKFVQKDNKKADK